MFNQTYKTIWIKNLSAETDTGNKSEEDRWDILVFFGGSNCS